MNPVRHSFKALVGLLALLSVGGLPNRLEAANAPTLNITGSTSLSLTDKQTDQPLKNATVSDGGGSPVTVTITMAPTGYGSLGGSPNAMTTIGPESATDASSAVNALVFAPVNNLVPIGSTETVTFTIWAADTNSPTLYSDTNTVTVTITPVEDPPTLTGLTSTNTTDEANVAPFAGATVGDVDNQGQQPVRVTIFQSDSATGLLKLDSSGFTGDFTNGYTYAATPTQVTTALRGLVFEPTANRLPVGSNDVTAFIVSVTDSNLTVMGTNTVTALSINDPPTISGVSTAPQFVQTGFIINPFATAVVGDVDVGDDTNRVGQSLTLQVTLAGDYGNGQLVAPAGIGFVTGGTVFTLPDATSQEATLGLQGLAFQAQSFPLTATNSVTFTVTVADNHGGAATNNAAAVDVYTPFTPPGLSGTRTGQRVNDDSTVAPFSTVSIQSFNGGAFSVIVHLDDDAKGQLINLSGFVKSTGTTPASYVFSGTSEGATAAIRQLLFQPTPNRINGSTNETTVFSIILVDGSVTNAPDSTTTVIVTPVNDPPAIQGTSPLVTIDDNQTLAPFPTVLVTDPDELGQQQLTMTIQLDDNAKGSFTTNSLGLSGVVSNNASYTIVGPPATVTTAIRQLVFAPTPHRLPVGLSENVTFTITADDSHGGLVSNSGTVVRVAATSGGPTISVPTVEPVSLPVTPPLKPLSAVEVSSSENVTLTLQVTNLTWGDFTSNSLAAYGFTNTAPGIYQLNSSASNATVALNNLEFTPNPNLVLGTLIVFSISAVDQTGNSDAATLEVILRQTQRTLVVTKTTDYDPSDPNVADADKNGTLRKAVLDAGNSDHITFDLRAPALGLPDYPATIHLQNPITVNKNLTLDGPGANLLSISGEINGSPGVELFQVSGHVTINRLNLTEGYDSFAGGAVEVNPGGSLKLSYCAVTDNHAEVWGGGIDVNQGGLSMDHCLIRGDSTGATLGQGGGGVSIYTELPCRIVNSTFAANQQLSPGGTGGGALYVEDFDPGVELDVYVLNCTFHDNVDASGQGSSIRPNVFNAFVQLQNTIVADGQGQNLEVDESGAITSLGGNLSDDSTASIFSIGGAPYDVTIFDPDFLLDQTNTNPELLPLANNGGGQTLTFALDTNSPAIDASISNAPSATFYDTQGTDQRGYWRVDGHPDIGAFEASASRRVVMEEINFDPPSINDQFIEFYVPHDSAALDLGGYQVFVHGTLRHTFSSQLLNPGEALVLFSHDATVASLPGGVYSQIAAGNLLMDTNSDTITLENPSNQVVLEVNYVGEFTSSDPNETYLAPAHQSIVLSPQFQGNYLPYQLVVAKEGGRTPNSTELSAPGYDASGTPLAAGNAPPLAYSDSAATDAQTPLPIIPVLSNDVDADRFETLRVVGVGVTNGTTPGVTGTNSLSALGAAISINDSPTLGASVAYDPTGSAFLRSLPGGSNIVDTFQYTILDYSNGLPQLPRGSTSTEISNNLFKATATVSVTVTGVNLPPTPQDDGTNTNAKLITSEDAPLDFTTADTILANDTDPNSDDDSTTLAIISVEGTDSYSNSLQTLSALGAWVTLDIRFDRNQTHITYDPRGSALLNSLAAGQTAEDTFYYSVMDRHGAIGTAAVHITVTGVDDTPTANPDSVATDEDTPISIPFATLLANDTDPDTGITNPTPPVLTITGVSPVSAQGASVQIMGGSVLYDPTVSSNLNALARKEVVVDTFTYTVTDPQGQSSNAVVSVTVTGVNDTPEPKADHYATSEKTPILEPAPGLLSNDSDPDVNGLPPDDTLRVIPAVGVPSKFHVPVTLNADGSFSYDPTGYFDWLGPDQYTNDTFTYTVMDHSLTIANDDVFSVAGNSSSNVLQVLANDALLSQVGGALTITAVTPPDKGGTVAISSDGGSLVYTPPANYVGVEDFTYMIADGLGGSDTANVSIVVTVDAINGHLAANPDSFTVAKGTTVNLDVLANDNILPASGTVLTITGVSVPDHGGAAAISGAGPDNTVTYTPNPANSAPYTENFTYEVSGGGAAQATGTVAVTVMDRSNTLTANDDTFTVLVGGGTSALDVLANDQILPGPNTNLTIVAINTNGVTGTVSINATGDRLLYTPSPIVQSNTPETVFYYTISDGAGGTATASVAIQVQTSGFIANDDVFSVMQNSVSNSVDVLLNDVILPSAGQTLTITDVGLEANAPNHGGTVTISPNGKSLLYTPAPDFSGEEDFTYEISDGTVARAEGHVRMKVVSTSTANSNPDAFSVARNTANNVLPVLQNDYPLPLGVEALSITGLETNGVLGTVALSGPGPNNALLYTPRPGFIGREVFAYESTDSFGNRGTNQVTVNVGNLVTHSDQFSVLSGSTNNALDVLANDLMLPDTTGVRPISAVGGTDEGGTVVPNASSTLVLYAPAPGFVGTEHFMYQITDDSGATYTNSAAVSVVAKGSDRSNAVVTVTIAGVNDPPTITGTQSGQAITDKQTDQPFSTVTVADVDEFGLQPLTVTVMLDNAVKGALQNLGGFIVSAPGVYTMSGLGADITTTMRNLTFVPTQNRIPIPTTETSVFTILAYDGYVTVTNSSTTVNVTAVDDPPTIAGTLAGQRAYDHLPIHPFASVTVADVDNLGLQTQAVQVVLDQSTHGYLASLGGFVSTGSGAYSLSGVTPAQATAALRGLLFVPTPDGRLAPGGSETTRLTLSVNDSFLPAVVDTNTTVISMDPFIKSVLNANGSTSVPFGYSVGAERDLVLVGTPNADGKTSKSGAAHLFARNTGGPDAWGVLTNLQASDGKVGDQFGAAVALSGDTAVIGAPFAAAGGNQSGAIYVFDRNPTSGIWSQTTKVVPADGANSDEFGDAVAIGGDTIVVGSPLNKPGASRTGAAYVFYRNQGGANAWGLVRKLVSSDGANGDDFGVSVAIYSNTVVVGDQLNAGLAGSGAGAAYVFDRNQGGADNWGQTRKIVASDGVAGASFGRSVAISGDLAVVGAPNDTPGGVQSGSVYAFLRNQGGTGQWGQVNKSVPADGAAGDQFGFSVALDGQLLVAGAPHAQNLGVASGAAYLYASNYPGLDPWSLVQKIVPAGNTNTLFGFAMSLSRNTLALGADYDDPSNNRFAKTYIYRLKFDNAPLLVQSIPDQFATLNSPFSFTVPPGTFTDPDPLDPLILSAPIPAGAPWLTFDPATNTFSGTPTALGTNFIQLTATDQDGEDVATSFNIIVTDQATGNAFFPAESAKQVWRSTDFSAAVLANPGLEATVWGDNADPDGDGVSNLEEYLFGTDPLHANPGDRSPVQVAAGPEPGTLLITYRRRTDDRSLVYSLQGSADLANWQAADASMLVRQTISSAGPGLEQVTQEVRLPSGGASAQFFRINVAQLP